MKLEDIAEKMHSGKIYACSDEQLVAEQTSCLELLYDYNHSRPSEGEKRQQLLKDMFAECGEDNYIEPPFHANWGGRHVHFGSHIYANVGLSLVDDTHIYIGDNVMFGPHVIVCTATHPISPALREKQMQYNLPVHIGKNAWIGGGVFIMPGVTIGENSVIGANSIVTKDIPANVVAAGNPCRILRKITAEDDRFYDHGKPIEL